MELPYDPLESLRLDGEGFIETVRGVDPATAVPACPGWTVDDLTYHQGEVWYFWGRVLTDQITDRGQLQHIPTPERLEGDALIEWITSTHTALLTALVEADPDRDVWTWTGANRKPSWVARRMAQEVAVHRADAAHATGTEFRIPARVAADGIDEFLTWFAGNERREGEMKPGGTVHLHCTDTDEGTGEWFVSSLKAPSCTFTREHRKGDAAIRGEAHDLLMWLWRRSTKGVEIIGSEVVARRFRAYTDLD